MAGRRSTNLIQRLWRHDKGGEVTEYALIAGLIVVAAVAIITAAGTKAVARWTSIDQSIEPGVVISKP